MKRNLIAAPVACRSCAALDKSCVTVSMALVSELRQSETSVR
ncbi:hypothetical protein QN239_32050 [Mycolicibacterium sp. Y3]